MHRCDIQSLPYDAVICLHHKKVWLDLYSNLQRKCCNPFNMHEDVKRKSLREITLQQAKEINQQLGNQSVKSGMKLCTICRNKKKTSTEHKGCDYENPTLMDLETDSDEYIPQEEREEHLNQSITSLGVSPYKLSKVSPKDRISYAKRKFKEVKERSREIISTCAEIPPDSLSTPVKERPKSSVESDMDFLVCSLKEKMKLSTKRKQISLLSLAPKSWSYSRIVAEFGVTEYMAQRVRKLQDEHGILPEVPIKKGKNISENTIKKVLNFFYEDDVSRLMPGSKDYKSVKEGGRRVQKQKRLILMNLNEAYCLFKIRYSNLKIGISKFCELRPEEFITVGSKGTHSVCVCTVHQNVKLLLASLPLKAEVEITYHDLLNHIVCSTDNSECMLHRCENCPGVEGLQNYLGTILNDEADQIEYKQWVSTDRTTLTDHVATPQQFIELLTERTDKLAVHHFISKHQSSYFRNLKENLSQSECIILLDFAENYSFIVQDAAQGYHWDNSQCTLHPFAVYIRDSTDDGSLQIKCHSLCIISDCLKHDTVAVHTFLKQVLPHVRNLLPTLKKVIYFSDGSAAQYKNYKNFRNLMQHKEDFGLQAEWHFFATSHGKSPCDGIGGTVKRSASRASLQATTSSHILTPRDLFQYAENKIKNIQFFWIGREEVTENAKLLQDRFEKSSTIPGTREHHAFIPLDSTRLQISRISGGHSFVYDTSGHRPHVGQRAETTMKLIVSMSDMIPGQYVACKYDEHWWLGNICETSEEEDDVRVKFMHPHGPSRAYSWPRREDLCWIPLVHIIKCINAPLTSTGRHYKLPPSVEKEIKELFKLYK